MNRLRLLASHMPVGAGLSKMANETYKAVVLNQRPKDEIVIGETFKFVERSIPNESNLEDGQVLVETLYLSLDPAMRGWLNDARSYVPPVQINETMRGATIGRVIASKSSQIHPGDLVTAATGWTEYAVMAEKDVEKVEVPSNGRITDALGVLGLTGLTAYFGITDIGDPKPGELVVVSGAAGATGSVVCQIAKLKGARVVGIAGSDDKVQWLKELGCDEALNYKDPEYAAKFKAATKEYIDVFFDNVGGNILDLALGRAKPHARFVICGAISQYNAKEVKGPKNILSVISMRIRMEGFIVFDYAKRYGEARRQLSQWLNEGKLQRKEHVVKGGLDAAPATLKELYNGVNTGKLLVEIRQP